MMLKTVMNGILTPEQEQKVREKVDRGEYETPEAFIRQAVEQMLEQEEAGRLDTLLEENASAVSEPAESFTDVQAGLRRAMADVQAGRTISLEEFDREMRARHGIPG